MNPSESKQIKATKAGVGGVSDVVLAVPEILLTVNGYLEMISAVTKRTFLSVAHELSIKSTGSE